MHSSFARATGCAITAALVGCATGSGTHSRLAAASPLPGTESCVFTVNLFDWTVLDDSNLIVYAPGQRQPYLVRLFEPVFDLPFRESLGFEGLEHNGQLCKGDHVIVKGDIPSRTMISAVRALTPEQAKGLLEASRHHAAPAGSHHD